MTSLSIAATAERTGVSAHTLRYYERIGLIDPVGRDESGRRLYSDADLARVDFLRDYDTIEKTMLTRADAFTDTDAFVEDMRVYADLGIDTVIFVPHGDPVEFTKRLGPVGERLADL